MKRILVLLLALLASSALAQRPTVVVSIHPLYDLTRQIAGEHADVVRVLPPGASPHTFDPTPRDVARIAGADLVVVNGGYGIDGWLLGLVEASGLQAPIVNVFDAIEFQAIEGDHDHDHDHDHGDEHAHEHGHDHEHEHGHDEDHDHAHDHDHDHDHEHGHDEEHAHGGHAHDDHAHDDHGHDDHGHDDHDHAHGEQAHDHGPVNSHLWLDPILMIRAVPHIADALAEVDPDNAAAYAANATELIGSLEALHAELAGMLAPLQGEALVPFHDAWPYFARRYGLDLVVEIEPFPGREPSPAYLQYALGLIEGSGARAIFNEPQLSQRPAQIVAESAGLPLFTLDPVGGTPETETYQDLMRHNARVLLEALGN